MDDLDYFNYFNSLGSCGCPRFQQSLGFNDCPGHKTAGVCSDTILVNSKLVAVPCLLGYTR